MIQPTQYHVLLELAVEEPELLDVAADRYGFTTYTNTITVLDGQSVQRHFYSALVAVSLPGRQADLYAGGGVSTGSASATVPLAIFPALSLLENGVRFERIRARVWWWRPGLALDKAVLVWVGFVSSPEIDDVSGTFRFQISSGTREQDAPLPRAAIGDESRFPDAPDQALPQAVPVIYGTVTNLPVYRISDDPGLSPPAAATDVQFLVCGHYTPDFLCQLTDGADMTTGALAPQRGVDGRGDVYTYVEASNTTAGWSDRGNFFITTASGWKKGGEDAGSSLEVLVHRLGDVLVHLVTTYAAERFYELDRPRIFAARELLNRFSVGMIFNSPTAGSVLQALKGRFERQFPVTFNFAAGRFGWDYAGIPPGKGVAGSIVWGQNAHSKTGIRLVPIEQLRARFELAYNLDADAGGNTAVVRRDETNSGPCRAAFERWGISTVHRIEAPDVVDDDTARLLLEEQIQRLTKRRLRTSYTVNEPTWADWPLFSRVAVTDGERGWADKVFLVEAVTPQRPGLLTMGLISEDGI